MKPATLLAIAFFVPATIGHCAADERRACQRLAQYSAPSPVPGGLPGAAMPPPVFAPALPQAAPSLPASPALPGLQIPSPVPGLAKPERAPGVAPQRAVTPAPPPPPAARTPEAHAAEACDCHVAVDVPVYANGKIVGWRHEQHLTERSPRCCRK